MSKMSEYEHGLSATEEDNLDRIVQEKKQQIKNRRQTSKSLSVKKSSDDLEVINIKEFDLNSMPPYSSSDEKNGVKIVVIGKPGCFAPGTKILMYDGSEKLVENVQINDILMGDDNTPRKVLELYHDVDDMYEIKPYRGSNYTVNKMHNLVLICKNNYETYSKNDIIEISVYDYLNKDDIWKSQFNCFRSSGITCWEDKDEDFSNKSYDSGYNLNGIDNYKVSIRETRLNLIAGIIDSYGFYSNKYYKFNAYHIQEQIRNDIIFICRSLGFYTIINEEDQSIHIHSNMLKDIPTKKLKLIDEEKDDYLTSTFEIEYKGQGEYYGFSLDKNRRFLNTDFEVLRNTGKSTIIQDIVASKSHIAACAQIFSGTEDSNHYYSEKFAPCCVYNKLDMDAIKNFIVRQKAAKRFLPNPWAVQIIDDCTDDPSQLRHPVFQAYYKNGRHWNMIHILSLQYCLDILPSIRTNIDYTFILRETNQRNRKGLYENYAGCIPNYQMFQEIMDAVTEDFTALVINNRVQSNKIEDCVFWYKAKPDRLPPTWKFGHPLSWMHNDSRMDPNPTDSLSI
jgi:hypothetical protein